MASNKTTIIKENNAPAVDWSREDRDLLIRVDTKLDNLSTQVQTQNSIVLKELSDHEHRLQVVEGIHERIQPEKVSEEVASLVDWKKTFTARWKLIVGLATGLGTVVGAIIGGVVIRLVGGR